MESKQLICILCPRGCHLDVSKNQDGVSVKGNFCKRGINYGITEMTNPVRKLTSTIRIKGAHINRLPIITDRAIPKSKVMEVMRAIEHITVQSPIHLGDIVIANVAGTEANIVATRSL